METPERGRPRGSNSSDPPRETVGAYGRRILKRADDEEVGRAEARELIRRKTTAAGYARVSDKSKQGGERNVSLGTQTGRIQAHCATKSYVLLHIYTDKATGRKDDREDYQRLLAAARRGEFGVVVVQYLDRFGRNAKEILRRYWELEELGVRIECTDEDISEQLVLLLRAGIAEGEAKKTSVRVRSNMTAVIRRKAHPARVPYGLRGIRGKIDSKTGRARIVQYKLIPQEVETIRTMRDLLIKENLGRHAIAERLNQEGSRTRNGKLWDESAIRRILTDPARRGAMIYGRKPRPGNPQPEIIVMEGVFPRVFEDEEFREIQEHLEARRTLPAGKTLRSTYLLSGIARCGHCGGPLTAKLGSVRLRGDGRYSNYMCRNHLRSKGCLCKVANGHSTKRLEEAVLRALAPYADSPTAQTLLESELASQAEGSDSEAWRAELTNIERELTEINKAFLEQLALLNEGYISRSQLLLASQEHQQRESALTQRRDELNKRLQAEEGLSLHSKRVSAEVTSFLQDFRSLPVSERKARLQRIVSRVIVWEDGQVRIICRQ